jgi:oligopeptide transport system substrate-binding protein
LTAFGIQVFFEAMLRKSLSFHVLFSVVFASLTLLSACSGKSKNLGACNGNIIRYPMIADAKSLDPITSDDRYSHLSAGLIYEGLVQYHYLKRPLEVVPALAEAMPEISKDELTYTFKIKKGVKFQDSKYFEGGKGREVKAKDFVYSFLRLADPKITTQGYWIYEGKILGIDDWRAKQQKAEKTDFDNPPPGFAALDDYTLQIKLTQKYPQLLYVLAMTYAAVVPREVVEALGKDFLNNPVGTGPYVFEKWMRNAKISFKRNPNYRDDFYPAEGEEADKAAGLLEDAGKKLPFADCVEMYTFIESQPLWLNFMKGNIDFAVIPKDNYESAVDKEKKLKPELANREIRLNVFPQQDVTYLAFNVADPQIEKGGPNLRKAISMAINEEEQIELFRNGRAIVAQSPIPPGLAGYDPEYRNPHKEFNLEKAKEFLKKSGFPKGTTLNYETTNSSDSRQMAESIQRYLKPLGIELKINMNQFSELLQKIDKKKAQMWGIAWGADYPDAENFLQLLYGPNKAPGPNGSNYNNAEYNRLYQQMAVMRDSPERREIIKKMVKILEEDMPWVPHDHRISFAVVHPWIKNTKFNDIGGNYSKYFRVDMDRKVKGN